MLIALSGFSQTTSAREEVNSKGDTLLVIPLADIKIANGTFIEFDGCTVNMELLRKILNSSTVRIQNQEQQITKLLKADSLSTDQVMHLNEAINAKDKQINTLENDGKAFKWERNLLVIAGVIIGVHVLLK